MRIPTVICVVNITIIIILNISVIPINSQRNIHDIVCPITVCSDIRVIPITGIDGFPHLDIRAE